ncbi:MAG: type 1 glutamine amidotransferase domain-containing protein [Sporomusaceae bacterium]|nr:type 1 glutamine amidotransferase domain-containing protein [Sporomusaceae bacterium]
MKKVLLFIENQFEDMEAMYPYYRLQEAGFGVDVAGPQASTVYKGKYGYPLTAGLAAASVKLDDYAAVILPGGQAPDKMRLQEAMVDLVREADRQGLVIGAICHGPQLLIEADIIRGRNLTCYRSILTDVLNAGGIYHDLEVIIDDNLITSRTPADLPAFMQEILKKLA